jgi:hypothetical protein
MIPEEVAEIAYLLRECYPDNSSEQEFDYSVKVAWKIYNLWQTYEETRLKGNY